VSFKDALLYLKQLVMINRLIAMQISIGKPKKKSTEDIKQEQYVEKIKTTTEYYNGIRINETLLGRIIALKKMSDVFDTNKEYLMISKSLPRPKTFIVDENGMEQEVVFKDPTDWLINIQKEYKEVVQKLQKYEEEEREREEQLKAEFQEQALKTKREFLIEYGLLPKVA